MKGSDSVNCSTPRRAALYLWGNSHVGSVNHTTIVFEPGCVVQALRGSFHGLNGGHDLYKQLFSCIFTPVMLCFRRPAAEL
jgi:hypothetical protein